MTAFKIGDRVKVTQSLDEHPGDEQYRGCVGTIRMIGETGDGDGHDIEVAFDGAEPVDQACFWADELEHIEAAATG